MEIKLKWRYAEGTFDTKTMELISLPGGAKRSLIRLSDFQRAPSLL